MEHVMKRGVFSAFVLVWLGLLVFPAVTEWAAGKETISGTVLDAASGLPVAGALVRIQADLEEPAVTKADGTFSIKTVRAKGSSVVVTAGALDAAGTHPAYYNAGRSALVGAADVELRIAPILAGDDRDYTFVTPNDCTLCHTAYVSDFMQSAHAGAARNTWVKDVYDGSGTPGGAAGFTYKGAHPTLNGDCAECHAPMQSARNPGDNTEFTRDVAGDAREFGVSCDVCHKTVGIAGGLGLPGVQKMLFRRGAATDDMRARREAQFGPLTDASTTFGGVMRPAFSALHQSSLMCAACHEDNNDHDFDGDYLDEGSVPSEESYSEWLASPYAQPGANFKTCQTCHMPPTGANVIAEQYGTVVRDPSQVHSHRFAGTSDEYVQNAGTVRVVARRDAGALRIAVAVTNDRTGHDLPGGISLRHAILLVKATDESGAALAFVASASSTVPAYAGVGDPAVGNFAGLPGKGFAKVFTDGTREGVFFTEAIGIASDTRIPAGATDWSDYVFELPDGLVPVQVEAKLLYRRAFRDLVLEKNWTQTGHGRPNPDVIGPEFGIVMGRAEVEVGPSEIAIDTSRVRFATGLVLKVSPGASVAFADGATVEITDRTGAWMGFSRPATVSGSGRKLVQNGSIGGVKLRQYWQSGDTRFVRVTNPDGAAATLRLVRRGDRFEPI
jgi:hypothetical protein